MLSDRCLSCLSVSESVTLLYCGQTVGWIRMPLAMEVGYRPRPHCVRWGPSSPAEWGTAAPHFSAHVYVAKRSPISATELLFICPTAIIPRSLLRQLWWKVYKRFWFITVTDHVSTLCRIIVSMFYSFQVIYSLIFIGNPRLSCHQLQSGLLKSELLTEKA